LAIPPSEVIISGGFKKIISYKQSGGKVEKKTRTFRQEKRLVKVSKAVVDRRSMVKFGVSKGLPAGTDSASTNVVMDDVYLTLSSARKVTDDKEEEDPLKKLKGGSVVKCRYCSGDHWSTKCPFKDNLTLTKPEGAEKPGEEGGAPGGGPPAEGGAPGAVNAGGRYVPPSQRAGGGPRANRGGESMNNSEESNTIRVTNISENTREEDLRELFRGYGHMTRCYLATDRETGLARGFAFISFVRREDAANAIAAVNGHGYDHLILQVEWAEERKPDAPRN
jgi:translation initiation factor 3 subunit G